MSDLTVREQRSTRDDHSRSGFEPHEFRREPASVGQIVLSKMKLTIGPREVFQRFMQWRSLGYSALLAYIHTFERKPEIDLVHFPDPRRPLMRRHWQRADDWGRAIASADPSRVMRERPLDRCGVPRPTNLDNRAHALDAAGGV